MTLKHEPLSGQIHHQCTRLYRIASSRLLQHAAAAICSNRPPDGAEILPTFGAMLRYRSHKKACFPSNQKYESRIADMTVTS